MATTPTPSTAAPVPFPDGLGYWYSKPAARRYSSNLDLPAHHLTLPAVLDRWPA